jgi:hypothetical protein
VIFSFFFEVNGLSSWVEDFGQDKYVGFLLFVCMCNLRCKSWQLTEFPLIFNL